MMCLGIPMKVIQLDGDTAVAEAGGIRKDVRLDLVSDITIGDYILIHTGFAIEKLDPKEAVETLELIKEVYRAGLTGSVDGTEIDPEPHPDKDPK
jgi:hydrogenase expression/formation protein HypC